MSKMKTRKPQEGQKSWRHRRQGQTAGQQPAAAADASGARAPWLYGIHAVLAALANPARRCRKLWLTPETAAALAGRLPSKLPPEIVTRGRFAEILPPGAVHQGIALLADLPPAPDLADVLQAPPAAQRRVVLFLDQVTDPHNVGAILRSAAAFGASAVVVTERHAPEVSGALAKAASGALETVRLVRVTNLARALDQAGAAGYWRLGLEAKAERLLAGAAPAGDIALVLGSEGSGLRRLTRERCDDLVRLPIVAEAESLNVSNAAAVTLYELARDGAAA